MNPQWLGTPPGASPGEAAESGGSVRNAAPTFDRSPAYKYNPNLKYPRAVRCRRFKPATEGGVPVRATVKIPVEFDLKDAR
jgi:hypothetical protein